MGGALAQIAAAYYADLAPTLVTFATPSIGACLCCAATEYFLHVLTFVDIFFRFLFFKLTAFM
jgi:hypothetical protein